LDVDGVAADFLGAVRRELYANALHRPAGWESEERIAALTHHGAKSYDTLDPALVKWLWPRVDADPVWWEHVPPLTEVVLRRERIATEIVQLKKLADVLWVTARRSRTRPAGQQTASWLLRREGLDWSPHVVAVQGWQAKVELCRVLQPFAVVDDRPEILLGVKAACPKALVLAPPWPYTAGVVPDADRCGLAEALGRIADKLERECPRK
jgi:hypothetical protein